MPPAGFDDLDLHDALRAAQAAAGADELGRTALHVATEMGHIDATKFLLEQGMAPTTTDAMGQTPLHLAARHGRLDMVRLLLTAGADAQARDARGLTPAQLAAAASHPRIVELLLAIPRPGSAPRGWRRWFGPA